MVYMCPGCNQVVSVNHDAQKKAHQERLRFEQSDDGRCSHCHADKAAHRGPIMMCMVSQDGPQGPHGRSWTRNDSLNGEVVVPIGIPIEEHTESVRDGICGCLTWAIAIALSVSGCILLLLMAAKIPDLDSDGRITVGIVSVVFILIGMTVMGWKFYPYFRSDLLCAESGAGRLAVTAGGAFAGKAKQQPEGGRQSLLS